MIGVGGAGEVMLLDLRRVIVPGGWVQWIVPGGWVQWRVLEEEVRGWGGRW